MTPRQPRSSRVMIDPAQIVNDPLVMAMSPEAAGAHMRLWLRSWAMHEPGVIEPATDQVLASLAMVPTDTWLRVKDEVARAWDTTVPGKWSYHVMTVAYLEQQKFVEQQRESGKQGARKRWARKQKRAVMAGLSRAYGGPNGEPMAKRVLGSKDLDSKDRPLSLPDRLRADDPAPTSGPAPPEPPRSVDAAHLKPPKPARPAASASAHGPGPPRVKRIEENDLVRISRTLAALR